MKKFIAVLGLTFILCASAPVAFATPTLGVATDTGVYAYTGGTSPTDEYIKYFASSIVPAIGSLEGFVLGSSGSQLTVFTRYDPSLTQVYLLADTAGNNLPMTFGGQNLTLDNGSFITGKAGGYQATPYSYLSLPNSGWATHTFGNTLYYLYSAPITYTDEWSPGYYFFSAAETNGSTGLLFSGSGQKDDFSPKTTSAGGSPTPEPATMALFGAGGLGLGFLKRRNKASRV